MMSDQYCSTAAVQTALGTREKARSETILAFGSNGSSQLGLGHAEDMFSPADALSIHNLDSAEVSSITSGGNHTIVLFNDGRVATAGSNEYGQLFHAPESLLGRVLTSFEVVDEEAVQGLVTLTAATWTASFVVTREGMLLCSGLGVSGELGLGPNVTLAREPTVIKGFPPQGTKILRLSSCMAHVVAVLSNGEVWGWGKGRKGQLGGPVGNVWSPRKIHGIPFAAVEAVCGKDFTCIFSDSSTGQLAIHGPDGKDRFGIKANAPSSVSRWKQVGASWGSIYVLDETGRLHGWGRDDHGQLPPENLPSLRAFAPGSEHCLGLIGESHVIAWGWGEHGNCGKPIGANGDVIGPWNRIEVRNRARAVRAGCATSFVVIGHNET